MFKPIDYRIWNKAVEVLVRHITKNAYSPDEGAIKVRVKKDRAVLSAYRSDMGIMRVAVPIINHTPEEVDEVLVVGTRFKELPTKIKAVDDLCISLTEECIRYTHPSLGMLEEGVYLGEDIIPDLTVGKEVISMGAELASFIKSIPIDKQTEWPHIKVTGTGICLMGYYKGSFSKLEVPIKAIEGYTFQVKQEQVLAMQEMGNVGALYYDPSTNLLTYLSQRKAKDEVECSYSYTWELIQDSFEDCLPEGVDWPRTQSLIIDKHRLGDILTWQEHKRVRTITLQYNAPYLLVTGGTEGKCECEVVEGDKPWGKYEFNLDSVVEAIEIKNLPQQIILSVYELPLDTGVQPALLLEGQYQKALVLGN